MKPISFCCLVLGIICALSVLLSPRQSAAALPAIELARVPGGGIQPQIVAKGKVVHLTYFAGKDSGGDVFYVRSDDEGRSWSAPLRVNSQAGSAIATGAIRGAHLCVGRGGRVFVVWNGSNSALLRNAAAPDALAKNGAAPLLFARLNDEGNAFEPQRNLMTRTFNLDGGASLAADDGGAVFVVWHANDAPDDGEDKRQVFLAISRDDGATFAPETPIWKAPTGACGCCQLRLSATDNRLNLLYRAATDFIQRATYSLVSTDGGRTWTGADIAPWKLNYCPMSSYALARNGEQTVGAWETAGQIYWSPLAQSGAASQIISAPDTGNNRKHPALAINGAGHTLLVWTQDTAWKRGGTLHGALWDEQNQVTETLPATPATPTWSFPTTFARADGSFVVLY